MKHNPRLNEKMARLPGFSDIHPLQPQSTVQGALALMNRLAHWLKTLTGMPAVALTPQGRRPRRALRPAGHPRRP
jgi:glycine dehydrogenase subunit 2